MKIKVIVLSLALIISSVCSKSSNTKEYVEKGKKALESKNFTDASKFFKKACDGGCYNLGYMYENGEGVSQDKSKAVQLFKKGCDGGDAKSCTNLGVMYDYGKGVSKDKVKAAQYYKKACDGGCAMGCTGLGYMYINGKCVSQDKVKAVQLFKKGCDGGDAGGCYNLGYMYENGEGVSQDKSKAVQLYKKGCDGGDTKSCINLGYMYENGEGVSQDKVKAVQLYKKGCDGGEALGCTNLDQTSSTESKLYLKNHVDNLANKVPKQNYIAITSFHGATSDLVMMERKDKKMKLIVKHLVGKQHDIVFSNINYSTFQQADKDVIKDIIKNLEGLMYDKDTLQIIQKEANKIKTIKDLRTMLKNLNKRQTVWQATKDLRLDDAAFYIWDWIRDKIRSDDGKAAIRKKFQQIVDMELKQ